MTLTINDHISLELTAQQHAAGLFEAVDNNREHLSRFLPWVGNMQSTDDFKGYISHCELLYQQQTDVSFVIMVNNKTAGRIGMHHIQLQNKTGAIGYWLAKEFEGQGIITKACKTIIQYGFEQLALNRIEIKAIVNNVRSQAIPEKLHFKREGILREAEWVNNEFHDLVIYSLLRSEWEAGNKVNA